MCVFYIVQSFIDRQRFMCKVLADYFIWNISRSFPRTGNWLRMMFGLKLCAQHTADCIQFGSHAGLGWLWRESQSKWSLSHCMLSAPFRVSLYHGCFCCAADSLSLRVVFAASRHLIDCALHESCSRGVDSPPQGVIYTLCMWDIMLGNTHTIHRLVFQSLIARIVHCAKSCTGRILCHILL